MEKHSKQAVADAVKNNWVDRLAPAPLKPYARLARWDRPIGWWLLLWPCWWSVTVASDVAGYQWPSLWYLFLFLVGAIAMRGAGCTYNDIVDRNLDALVERTRSRPLPSGQVSVFQASVFLSAQALVGLIVLLQFNRFTIVAGLCSLIFVAIYPFMKRITNWPQLFLGLAFSWGALVGWSAVLETISWASVLLYLGAILWTIGYDTIYAHQDKEDDALIGVKSTARLFEKRTKLALSILYLGCTILYGMSFFLAGLGLFAYAGLVLGLFHLIWQMYVMRIDDSEQCLKLFRSNRDYGWIIFAGLLLNLAL